MMRSFHRLQPWTFTLRSTIVRIFNELTDPNVRTVNRYFRAKMLVSHKAFMNLIESGELNPADGEPGSNHDTMNRYTPAALAISELEEALGHVDLTIQYAAYCREWGGDIYKLLARNELDRDIATLHLALAKAQEHGVTTQKYLKLYPRVRFFLES